MDKKDKELLDKLNKASIPDGTFVLTLKIDDKILEERRFSAGKYSEKTLDDSKVHFLMNDLIKRIYEYYDEQEKINQELLKKEQMDKLWSMQDKNNKREI